MQRITVSTTEFRNNLAEYLNLVRYQDQQIVIKKNQQTVAELSRPKKLFRKRAKKKKLSQKELKGSDWFGMWKNRWKGMSSVEVVDLLRARSQRQYVR